MRLDLNKLMITLNKDCIAMRSPLAKWASVCAILGLISFGASDMLSFGLIERLDAMPDGRFCKVSQRKKSMLQFIMHLIRG